MITWFFEHTHALSYFACAFIITGATLFVLLRRLPFALPFSGLCTCFLVWMIGLGTNYIVYPTPHLEHWFTFYYFGISFIPVAFFFFTIRFLQYRSPLINVFFPLLVTGSSIFTVLSFTSSNFIESIIISYHTYLPKYGATGKAMIGYLATSIAAIFLLWAYRYRSETDPLQKRRIAFMLVTFCLSFLGFIDFLPGVGLDIYPLGYIALTAILLLQTYILFIYRVVKLQSILLTITQQTLILLLAALPWAMVLWFVLHFRAIQSWLTAWLLSLVGFLIFVPYLLYFREHLSKLLFRRENAFLAHIQQFTENIVFLRDPDNLLVLIEGLLVKVLGLKRICIAYKTTSSGFLFRAIPGPVNIMPESVESALPLLKKRSEIIFKEDVYHDTGISAVRQKLLRVFDELQISIIMPMAQKEDFLGVLFLETGRIPHTWEFQFLSRLQPYLVIAMNNSYLYDHIRHLNLDLEEVNDRLNQQVSKRTSELEEALSKMKQIHVGQSNFFNMASHHLRTPLTSIKASSSLLWSKNPMPNRRGLYHILDENISRLENLINNIIEIAKIENGSIALASEPIHIHQLIWNAYFESETLYASKHIDWHFDIITGPPVITADSKRLYTVLANLFSNAFKFAPQNGHVEVTWKLADATQSARYDMPFPSNKMQAEFMEFTIADNGEGISENERESIFDIFRQAKDSHKRYQGPGLGLYLVKNIIQAHGGAVLLESRLHEGSRFSFLIPAFL